MIPRPASPVIQMGGGGGGPRPRLVVRGQTGVPGRDGATAVLVQTPGDPRHDVVGTPAAGVVLHLLLQIALIEPGQARRRIPVALAIQPVAGEAGVARPAGAAAHGDHFAGRGEAPVRHPRRGVAGGERQDQDKQRGRKEGRRGAHPVPTPAYGAGSGAEPPASRRIGSGEAGKGCDAIMYGRCGP